MHPSLRTLSLALVLSLAAKPSAATMYTIGSDGAFPTLNAAFADAIANPDNHEFRLQVGNHVGNIAFAINGEKVWVISGGWNASFTSNPIAPNQTIWQAGGLGGTALTFNLADTAQLLIRNLTVFGGLAAADPGGVYGGLANSSFLSLQDCRITSNQSAGSSAGLRVIANQSSGVNVSRCEFTNNVANGGGMKFGVGAYLRASQSASIDISDSYFAFNQDSSASSGGFGIGLSVEGYDNSSIGIRDTVIEENTAQSNVATGAGAYLSVANDATLNAEALRIEGNAAPNATAGLRTQAYVALSETSDLILKNSLLVNSALAGLSVNHSGTGSGHITSCTIANHQGYGISYSAVTGTHALTNTIVHNNEGATFGLIADAPVVRSNNLGDDVSGVTNLDPHFANANSDFHLQNHSPAINAGANGFNTSLFDFERNPRVVNGTIDIGAYENQFTTIEALFGDGFEAPL